MKQDTVILGSMDRYLMTRPRKSNTYDEEETDGYSSAFHPSMLSKNDCIRAIVYSLLHSPKTNLQRSPKGERIFDNGHSWGHQIQGYLYDMGLLLGTWECVYCGNIWTDMDNPSPKNCPCCEHGFVGYVAGEGRWHDLIYREVAITGVSPSGDRKILGHADGLFMINNIKHFLEIKTIKARDQATKSTAVTFETLMQPLPDHLLQLNLYLEYNDLEVDRGVFIYLNKNTQDMKEFRIKKLDLLVDIVKDRMTQADTSLKEGVLPDRKCGFAGEERFCPWLDLCFSEHTFEDADRRAEYGRDN